MLMLATWAAITIVTRRSAARRGERSPAVADFPPVLPEFDPPVEPVTDVDRLPPITLPRPPGAPGAPVHAELQARRACRACDELGWLLGADGSPVEPARRCQHPPAARAGAGTPSAGGGRPAPAPRPGPRHARTEPHDPELTTAMPAYRLHGRAASAAARPPRTTSEPEPVR